MRRPARIPPLSPFWASMLSGFLDRWTTMRRILFLVLPLLTLAVGTVYGGWAYHNLRFPFDGTFESLRSAAMRQTQARFRRAGQPQSDALEIDNLAAIGYADGSEEAEAESGVVRHDAERRRLDGGVAVVGVSSGR